MSTTIDRSSDDSLDSGGVRGATLGCVGCRCDVTTYYSADGLICNDCLDVLVSKGER